MAVVQTPQKGGRRALPSQKRKNLVNYSRGREIIAGALRPASLFHEEKSSIQERARWRSHVSHRGRPGGLNFSISCVACGPPTTPKIWPRRVGAPLISAHPTSR